MTNVWPFVGRDRELAALAELTGRRRSMVISAMAGVGKTELVRAALAGLPQHRAKWIAGTRSGASIPFGAIAHLIPADARLDSGRIGVLRQVVTALGPNVVLGVDDAHLLDEASVAVLTHLITTGQATAILAVRSGELAPDGVTMLWKDGYAERLDLEALSADAMDQLLNHALPGGIGGLSRRRLRGAAQGNPLALRELLAAGAVSQRFGLWHWQPRRGQRQPRIADLVASRICAVPAPVRAALEPVALAEPVPLSILEQLVETGALATAEETGLLAVDRSGQRFEVRLAHPLYGEAVCAAMSCATTRLVLGKLADAILATQMRRRDDTLRAALWQVDGGHITAPDVVRQGARQAVGRANLDLAERLARAARAADPGVEADCLLAEILEYRGKSQEAALLLSDVKPDGAADPVRWAVARAETVYWGSGDVALAEQILDEVDADLVTASRSWILFFDGRCGRVRELARQVLDRADATPQALVWAAASGTAAAGFLGDHAESLRIFEQGMKLAAAARHDQPWAVPEVETGRYLSLLAAGSLREARDLAEQGYHTALESGVPMMVCGWALWLGLCAAMQGHATQADALLREAIAGFAEDDTFRFERLCAAGLAMAAALTGNAGQAVAWMERADGPPNGPNRIFGPWNELARAWTHLVGGATDDAIAAANRAAQLAQDMGTSTMESMAAYTAIRMGAASPAVELTEPYATAAQALRHRDSAMLLRAAEQFERLGHDLLAAEATAAAARVQRARGQRSLAALTQEKAAALHTRCGVVKTPLLADHRLFEQLTPRERDVVLLAPEHSSMQIAARLGLRVTTVNNNLARAYAKLGVSGRHDLRLLLDQEML